MSDSVTGKNCEIETRPMPPEAAALFAALEQFPGKVVDFHGKHFLRRVAASLDLTGSADV